MVERKVLVRHYQKNDGTQVRQHTRKQEVNDKGPNQEIAPEEAIFEAPNKSQSKKEGKK